MIFERAYTIVIIRFSGVNGSLRRCSSDDFVEGHDGLPIYGTKPFLSALVV